MSCSASGTEPGGASVGCASGAYCYTATATPACDTTKQATGANCNNDYECANGSCLEGDSGTFYGICN
jgi:hypothetical protein